MVKKKSKGRQKVEMVKMEKQSNLQVTFSKRRAGLFKKASELCTLCGVEVGIVVFSPGHKVFSFGHPNVETIIDRFNGNPPQVSDTMQVIETHRNVNVTQLNHQLMQLTREIEVEKSNSERLNMIMKARQDGIWWEKPVEQLNLNELGKLKDALEGLKKNVTNEAERFMMLQSSNHESTIFGASASSSQGPVRGQMIPYNRNITRPITYPPYNHGYGHGGFY